MPISLDRLRSLGRIVLIAADTLVALALVATAALLWLEHGWVQPKSLSPEEAFNRGTIGTELMPLVVAQVLPDMYPQHFQPGGAGSGPWCEQFGFLPTQSEGCKDLPLGFAISSYRPGSGAPSPVPFVGFSCALCHTTELHGADGTLLDRVPGPGNTSLNLFAWLDALQAAVLDRTVPPGATPNPAVPPPYTLTVSRLSKAYGARMHRSLGAVEKLMVMLWLDQFRTRLTDGLPRFDDPYGDGRSRDPDVTPTGPLRTQPFRTLVRQVLDRPGDVMAVYTKIATVFSEGTRTSAQFDGSITDLYARSAMAAFAAGATVENMKLPEIANNIRRATDYTKSLHPHKTFAEYFPDSAERSPERLAQGREVYRRYCFSCHGDWEGAAWSNGPRTGEVVPLA
ncbi:MAG: cytochrome c, partial [Acetobacteraceae bacterium]|nr:cytochrome c [Acetobacteraceae bacterium]